MVLEHPGAVVVLAVDDDERVLCLRQYRHPARMRMLELPAGLLDVAGEEPRAAAERELLEEAGLEASDWVPLVSAYSSPGITTEQIHYFLARGLREADRGDFAPAHEEADMETLWVPYAELLAACLDGRVQRRAGADRGAHRPAPRPGRQTTRLRGLGSAHEGRRPQGSQEPRVPRGHHPDRRARAGRPRPRGLRREGRRRRLADRRRGVRRRRRQDRRHRRRGLGHRRRRRHGAQGQGARRRGVPPDAGGADALHLPPPGRGQAADRGADQAQGHRHRLRDGAAALGRAAAALPDVRGRRLPGAAGRRLLADEGPGRPRRADGRRRRRGQRQGRHHRRRRLAARTPPTSRSAWAPT